MRLTTKTLHMNTETMHSTPVCHSMTHQPQFYCNEYNYVKVNRSLTYFTDKVNEMSM